MVHQSKSKPRRKSSGIWEIGCNTEKKPGESPARDHRRGHRGKGKEAREAPVKNPQDESEGRSQEKVRLTDAFRGDLGSWRRVWGQLVIAREQKAFQGRESIILTHL